MPRTWQASDGVETVTDAMVEQFGNAANYNVIDGCDISYSATGLGITISAGNVRHNGSKIAVAGNSVTLIPDGTNPLWALVGIDSSGVAQIVHGTAAANPTEPELGDYVDICKVLVEANQTIANACAHKLDKRLYAPRILTLSGSGAVATLSADASTTTSMANVTDLKVDVSANETYTFRLLIHYTASATADYYWRLAGPTGSVITARQIYTDLAASETHRYAAGSASTAGYANGFGTSTPGVIIIEGSAVIGSTAGSLQYQHQSSSGKTKAKSRLELF